MSAPTQPPGRDEPAALGSNPFDAEPAPDPFVEGLERLGLDPARVPHRNEFAPDESHVKDPETQQLSKGWRSAPLIAEIDGGEATSAWESLVPAEAMRRVAALAYLAEGESSYDRYGFSPEVTRTAFPILYAIHRHYFRVESEGHSNIPSRGPAVLCGNHAGVLPWDAAMIVTDSILHTDPPRLPRSVVDVWAGALPWVNVLYARGGQVTGTRENFSDLLSDGQLMLVFPEGVAGVRKTISERYQLRPFRVGFVEQALGARAPIVPVAVIGSENQTPVIFNLAGLAKRLGVPAFPLTPTFPWFGPLGLLPYPVSYRIVYGEPLHLHERFEDPDKVEPHEIENLSHEVRQVVQELVDRNR